MKSLTPSHKDTHTHTKGLKRAAFELELDWIPVVAVLAKPLLGCRRVANPCDCAPWILFDVSFGQRSCVSIYNCVVDISCMS